MRYFFEVSYKGKNYNGWQSQANGIGVQTVLEQALSKLLREEIKIIGSGRTDTGVHCEQQFFHADIHKQIDETNFSWRLNTLLPKDIVIGKIRKVKPAASARYAAVERSYQYRITLKKNPFLNDLALYYFKPVDIENMNKAAALLCGTHDFECFSKVKTDVNHFICEIKKAKWNQKGDLLVFDITANRFLRGMVRAIVGTLLQVGEGKLSLKDFKEILKSKDRKRAGANVAAHGLYLVSVKYPNSIFINK
jgi:tRNA pseudouridine38-40 synthase